MQSDFLRVPNIHPSKCSTSWSDKSTRLLHTTRDSILETSEALEIYWDCIQSLSSILDSGSRIRKPRVSGYQRHSSKQIVCSVTTPTAPFQVPTSQPCGRILLDRRRNLLVRHNKAKQARFCNCDCGRSSCGDTRTEPAVWAEVVEASLWFAGRELGRARGVV